jgi:hypothetical protein
VPANARPPKVVVETSISGLIEARTKLSVRQKSAKRLFERKLFWRIELSEIGLILYTRF